MNLVKTFAVFQAGALLVLIFSTVASGQQFYIGAWVLFGWFLWVGATVFMLLAGVTDPGILPRNVASSEQKRDYANKLEDGMPYAEQKHMRVSHFVTTQEGYMKLKFCDTCTRE